MIQDKTATCRVTPTDAGPQTKPATRPRIMCRKAWGFESPLPQSSVTTKSSNTSSIDLQCAKLSAGLASKGLPRAESGHLLQRQVGSQQLKRFSGEGGAGGGYMRSEVALQNFLLHCRAENLKASTISWYESKLKPFVISYPNLPLKPEPIESFLASIRGEPHTRHAYFRALRAFYNFIRSRSHRSNPMDKVAAPRRPRKVMPTLEPAEIMRLLFQSQPSDRDKTILTLLIDTGARAAEVATLRWQDVKTDTICVIGKSGQREIPISDETKRLMSSIRQPGDNYVFMGNRGPLTRHGIYRIVRRYLEMAGISGPKLGPHRLRHTFGKTYLVAGGDTRSLQLIMGHANIATTEQYSSLALEDTIAKHHKFTPLQVAHAAAQESMFKEETLKEAENIVKKR
jgi:integrase/recombinase XerD